MELMHKLFSCNNFSFQHFKSLTKKFISYTGHTRHVFFPFDTLKDTAIQVAMEMVQELEISHLEPFEIGAMIDHEVSALVPTWRDRVKCHHQRQYSFNYEEDEDVNNHHPFFLSSSPSSPRGSGHMSASNSFKTRVRGNHYPFTQEWPQGTYSFYLTS